MREVHYWTIGGKTWRLVTSASSVRVIDEAVRLYADALRRLAAR